MGNFQGTFTKAQRAVAKERSASLACLTVVGHFAKEDSIEFAGPVSKEHAEQVAALIARIVLERARDSVAS